MSKPEATIATLAALSLLANRLSARADKHRTAPDPRVGERYAAMALDMIIGEIRGLTEDEDCGFRPCAIDEAREAERASELFGAALLDWQRLHTTTQCGNPRFDALLLCDCGANKRVEIPSKGEHADSVKPSDDADEVRDELARILTLFAADHDGPRDLDGAIDAILAAIGDPRATCPLSEYECGDSRCNVHHRKCNQDGSQCWHDKQPASPPQPIGTLDVQAVQGWRPPTEARLNVQPPPVRERCITCEALIATQAESDAANMDPALCYADYGGEHASTDAQPVHDGERATSEKHSRATCCDVGAKRIMRHGGAWRLRVLDGDPAELPPSTWWALPIIACPFCGARLNAALPPPCTNPECPIGCPDSCAAMVPDGVACGMSWQAIGRARHSPAVERSGRLAAERDGLRADLATFERKHDEAQREIIQLRADLARRDAIVVNQCAESVREMGRSLQLEERTIGALIAAVRDGFTQAGGHGTLPESRDQCLPDCLGCKAGAAAPAPRDAPEGEAKP